MPRIGSPGEFEIPNGFTDSQAKNWVASVLDTQVTSKIYRPRRDLVDRDLTVFDTIKRVEEIIYKNNLVFNCCICYYTMKQDANESYSEYFHR